jgi:hypothetical protein
MVWNKEIVYDNCLRALVYVITKVQERGDWNWVGYISFWSMRVVLVASQEDGTEVRLNAENT